jgi:hypothetical protein
LFARRVAQAASVLAVLGVLAGCSGSEETKENDVPKALCGVPVDQDLVSAFLPSGKEIAVQEKNPVPSRKRCQVNIDGKAALTASQEWWEARDGIAIVADAHPQLESAKSTPDGRFLYSGTGAVGKVTSCTNPDHPGHVLYTAVQVYDEDQQDAAAMKRLIADYTRSTEKSGACT